MHRSIKILLLGALLSALIAPSVASANIGIEEWDGAIHSSNPDVLRAGEHPQDITTTIDLTRHLDDKERIVPDAGLRNLSAELPPGLVGAPTVIETCNGMTELRPLDSPGVPTCPIDSIVGAITLRFAEELGGVFSWNAPIFNMRRPLGAPAQFGFNVVGTPVVLMAQVRSDEDYGINLVSLNTSQGLSFLGATTVFWGVPGAPVHDDQRCQVRFGGSETCNPSAPGNPIFGVNPGTPEPKPFLTLPTSCSTPGQGLPFGLGVQSWEQPPTLDAASFTTHLDSPQETTLVGTTECDRVPFKPQIQIQPTTEEAETPSGLEVALQIPQDGLQNPSGIAPSHLKDAKVTLPDGMSVNPSYGDGVTYCSASQVGLTTGNSPEVHFNKERAHCPDAAQAADVRIDTPLLDVPLIGAAYVAQQNDPKTAGAENPFDSTLALYIVAEGAGVRVKLAGKVAPDQRTGQVVTTFLNNPQVPFSRFSLKFKGGQRAPLSTPPICGVHTATAELTPWARPGSSVIVSDSFNLTKGPHGGPCPSGQTPPFKPGLLAGTINNAAGSYSPFHLRLTREDGEQEFTNFSIKLPPGLIGKLAGIPFCSDAAIAAAKTKSGAEEIANPSCPKASEVGRTEVGSGVGSLLVYVPGKVYLAGPYNGSALSIVAITAAKVGPFDLGTVAIRQALKINPETAEVFIDPTGSDPIPHIIDGIVVHARDIRAFVDKPQFVLNPTSCKRTSTASTVLGSGLDFASAIDDNPITVTSPFQAADCAALAFKPRLSLSLSGGTKRGQNPALRAVLRPRPGDANSSRISVQLPHSEFLDQSHIRTVCTRAQFNAGKGNGANCPPGSVYGHARAFTPLLDDPLEGSVFLRSSSNPLPDLVLAMHGLIDFNAVGRIDSVDGGIRNTFDFVPDAPISKVVVNFGGGKKSLLVNSTNLCKRKNRAAVSFDAQNGKEHNVKPVLKAKCKGKAKAQKKR